jgi:acylphosphatase
MVQGVFFRDSCRREAVGRGVGGWVRNQPDGSVEAVFEGPDAAVEAMCAWCETGPPHARVDRVEVIKEEPAGDATFRVRG